VSVRSTLRDRTWLRVDPELRRGLAYCVGVFLGVRLLLFVIGLVGVALLPDFSHVPPAIRGQIPLVPTPVSVPGWPAHAITQGWHNVFTAWEREDALWFMRIAASGYSNSDSSAAFFPLYPLVIRGVSFLLGGHIFAAALLVSNLAFLGALFVLYALTRSEHSEELARRAVLYAAVFPTALFFFAPYSESLFFLLVLVSFWAARRGQWEAAGLAGLLAALTRNIGLVLVLPLGIEAVHQAMDARPRRWPIRGLAWSLGPAVGTFAYAAYWRVVSGDWLAPVHRQAAWERQLINPITTADRATHAAFDYLGWYPGGYHLLDWLIGVVVVALAVYAVIKFRPSYGAYVVASILIPLAAPFPSRPLLSFTRFALPIFPIYWAVGRLTAGHRGRHELVVVASAALLGLMTLLFVNWYYVL
jgi:Mannosyltransferase (PIG-V)